LWRLRIFEKSPADQRIAPRGFEPLESNQQLSKNKTLTKNEKTVLSTSLDNLVQIYPDLTELVKAWPELPEQVKNTIKALIQTNNKGE